jgi:hypothetical protein
VTGTGPIIAVLTDADATHVQSFATQLAGRLHVDVILARLPSVGFLSDHPGPPHRIGAAPSPPEASGQDVVELHGDVTCRLSALVSEVGAEMVVLGGAGDRFSSRYRDVMTGMLGRRLESVLGCPLILVPGAARATPGPKRPRTPSGRRLSG